MIYRALVDFSGVKEFEIEAASEDSAAQMLTTMIEECDCGELECVDAAVYSLEAVEEGEE